MCKINAFNILFPYDKNMKYRLLVSFTYHHIVRQRRIQNPEFLSVFSPNAEKYGPEKLRTWTLFTQCLVKSCSLKFRNIHRKKPVLESFVNGVTGLIEVFVIKVLFERNILFPYVSFWRVRLKIHQKLKNFLKKELFVNWSFIWTFM